MKIDKHLSCGIYSAFYSTNSKMHDNTLKDGNDDCVLLRKLLEV